MLTPGMMMNNGRNATSPLARPRRLAASMYTSNQQQQQLQPVRRSQFVQRPYALRSCANGQGFANLRAQTWKSSRITAAAGASASTASSTGSASEHILRQQEVSAYFLLSSVCSIMLHLVATLISREKWGDAMAKLRLRVTHRFLFCSTSTMRPHLGAN